MEFSYKPINPFQNTGLSKEDRVMINAMRDTAYACGYRGSDQVLYGCHELWNTEKTLMIGYFKTKKVGCPMNLIKGWKLLRGVRCPNDTPQI